VRSMYNLDDDEQEEWEEPVLTREEREHTQAKLYALVILTCDSVPAEHIAFINEYIDYNEYGLALEALVWGLEYYHVPVDRADIADIDELGRLLNLDPHLTEELVLRDAPRDIRDAPRDIY
jgi:hypothetical protein